MMPRPQSLATTNCCVYSGKVAWARSIWRSIANSVDVLRSNDYPLSLSVTLSGARASNVRHVPPLPSTIPVS